MKKKDILIFSPEIPADLEHAPLIREEAIDWLETNYPGTLSFLSGNVLRMAGEPNRRWLIARLRARDIGDEAEFSLPDTADALTILFLRSKGVKFRDAVNGVVGRKEAVRSAEPRYGGVWNRLIIEGLGRLRRRIPPRLLATAVFSLLRQQKDQPNSLVIVKRMGKRSSGKVPEEVSPVTHDYVYRSIIERPAPSCSVIAPSREVMFLASDQLPARSEVTSRHFVSLRIATEVDTYELLLGTIRPASIALDNETLRFVGRILDIVFVHFETFIQSQSALRLETPVEPETTSADNLQLWLTVQFLQYIYTGALCEISETSATSHTDIVLASSTSKPWEPALFEPARSLEMLSGYVSRTGVPLVVEKVEPPLTSVIAGIEMELRYIKSRGAQDKTPDSFSALALPISASSGGPIGSLYLLMPRLDRPHLEVEVRILSVFSRIIGEMTERHRAAAYSEEVSANIVSLSILKHDQFKDALLELLIRKASELRDDESMQRDVRLPFLLLSTYGPEPDQFEPTFINCLKNWLLESLSHLEWRSFIRAHWPAAGEDSIPDGFIGEVPGAGIMIALGNLVTKDELDQIRAAFPTTINQTSPANSPVKFVAWVLDVPAQQISDAAKDERLPELADKIERWAFDVATVVDDIAQSEVIARQEGDWEVALRRIRQALRKSGAQYNSYLRRLAADCSFALGDWPTALKYAHEAVAISGQELGSGLVRSMCLEGDAHLCLCNPIRAWDLYSEAASVAPSHPLPRYYRGQGMLLIARLLRAYQDERLAAGGQDKDQMEKIDANLNILVNGAMEDLTLAADLLDHWGLIPESYQYRNFHLVPTLLGQGLGYLLARSPGLAASRFQSARRSFPKEDIFLREFLFAKCWEQGIHRQYAALLLSDGWKPLRDRLRKAFG